MTKAVDTFYKKFVVAGVCMSGECDCRNHVQETSRTHPCMPTPPLHDGCTCKLVEEKIEYPIGSKEWLAEQFLYWYERGKMADGNLSGIDKHTEALRKSKFYGAFIEIAERALRGHIG